MNRFLGCLTVSMMLVGVIAHAQTGKIEENAKEKASEVYRSPASNNFGMPTGGIYLNTNSAGSTGTGSPEFGTAPTPTEDLTKNYAGCSGITQSDYTTALFFTTGVFDKFKRDVNSDLAKQLLTYNYSLPQTAALFDTLNNYGNARYQQFQQSCKLDGLKQDAKQAYLAQCVTPELVKKRLEQITKDLKDGESGDSAATKLTDIQKEQLAYAQAWEICSSMQASNTTGTSNDDTMLKAYQTSNKSFAQMVKKNQSVNTAIHDMLCVQADGSASSNGCWQSLLLPKVTLCLDSSISSDGCADSSTSGSKKYGVLAPQVRAASFFDMLRYMMASYYVGRSMTPFITTYDAKKVAPNTLISAAKEASFIYDKDYPNLLGAKTISDLSDRKAGIVTEAPASAMDFENNFLGCVNHDALSGLKELNAVLKDQTAKSGKTINITLTEVTQSDWVSTVSKLDLGKPDVSDTDKRALAAVAEAALGCTLNQHVPAFDPNILASLKFQCGQDDFTSFYIMAGYDASLQGTRDVYQYLKMRLKSIYARLMTEPMVPGSDSASTGTTAATTTPQGTNSAELNRRLASAINDIMIPYVDGQLDRLDRMNQTRSQFAQRVQQIYAAKGGCISNGVLPGGAHLGKGGIGHR